MSSLVYIVSKKFLFSLILIYLHIFRVKTQINREGLGLKSNSYKAQDIKTKCRKLFKDFLQTDNYLKNDIVFLDFPKEDRMLIHQYVPHTSYTKFIRNALKSDNNASICFRIARSMGLKSRSYGKDQRKLIVSRKVNIWSLVRELTQLGGVTEKYELVQPTDEKYILSPTSLNI